MGGFLTVPCSLALNFHLLRLHSLWLMKPPSHLYSNASSGLSFPSNLNFLYTVNKSSCKTHGKRQAFRIDANNSTTLLGEVKASTGSKCTHLYLLKSHTAKKEQSCFLWKWIASHWHVLSPWFPHLPSLQRAQLPWCKWLQAQQDLVGFIESTLILTHTLFGELIVKFPTVLHPFPFCCSSWQCDSPERTEQVLCSTNENQLRNQGDIPLIFWQPLCPVGISWHSSQRQGVGCWSLWKEVKTEAEAQKESGHSRHHLPWNSLPLLRRTAD